MARTIPGAWNLAADVTTLAMCIQVTDRLDNVLGFTEHSAPLSIDISDGNGTITYDPEGSFVRTAFEARTGGRVASVDLEGQLSISGITKESVFAKLYDSALARIFFVDWKQPAAGIAWVDIGEIEETKVSGDQVTMTFKSLTDRYNSIEFGDIFQVDCMHLLGSKPGDIPPAFGDIGCQVQVEPALWSAGVQVEQRFEKTAAMPPNASPDAVNTVRATDPTINRIFEASNAGTTGGSEPSWNTTIGGTTSDNGITWVTRQAHVELADLISFSSQSSLLLEYNGDADDNWYQRGRIVCTAGHNVGLGRHIKTAVLGSPSGSGELLVETWTPFPLALEGGSPNNRFKLLLGCDRKLLTCVNKFRNVRNYGGLAIFCPNNDEWFKIPKQA